MRGLTRLAAAVAITVPLAIGSAAVANAKATAVPVVTSVTPSHGLTGSTVVVSGTNLTDPANGVDPLPANIDFGFGNHATIVSCAPAPAASCIVKAPAGTGTVDVRVTDAPDGTSQVNAPADHFRYTLPPLVTAKYVCGVGQAHYRWAVSKITLLTLARFRATAPASFWVNFQIVDDTPPHTSLLWLGSDNDLTGTVTLDTSDGYKLHAVYMQNGSQPPAGEAGAQIAVAAAPAAGARKAC